MPCNHPAIFSPLRRFPAWSICLAMLSFSPGAARAVALKLYVAPGGNDAWSGQRAEAGRGDGPLATLAGARDRIRKLKKQAGLPKGGATVEILKGTYSLAAPLELTAEDSGEPDAAIVYLARRGQEVRISGGVEVKKFQPVVDKAVLRRMDKSARDHVLQADLRLSGLRNLGEPTGDANRLEIFFRDEPMTLARWPNEGFVKIVDTVGGAPYDIRGTVGDRIGRFVYSGDRPTRWLGERDVWLHGYWFWDWAEQRQKVQSIDAAKRIITLEPPHHIYGYRKGQWYYALNLLPELDSPGEWYVERPSGVLYFWPPASLAEGKAMVSAAPSLLSLNRVAHVTFRGLIFEGCRATAIRAAGAADVHVVGCTIRNAGGWAADISGCDSGVSGCDIYGTGGGGVALHGGDRNTLVPARLVADNNHIHHYSRWNRMYGPAILLEGVGNRATHNLIDNAPHQAIAFSGNDHLIEWNEIHRVCCESNDAGAIYAGRNWTMRGTIIRLNYFHHISGFENRGCVGVYLDDQFSGTEIFGNLFYKVARAAMIGGGRDCSIINNVFVDCVPSVHVDGRGLGWAANERPELENGLKAVPYQSPLWAKRYPKLPNILKEDPMAPRGNRIARNICVGGRWGDFLDNARALVVFADNLIDKEPGFVDPVRLDFRLRPDSRALSLGFQPLPLETVGPYASADRASWPISDDNYSGDLPAVK